MGILVDVKIKLHPVSVRLCVVCLCAVERAPFMHMLCLHQQDHRRAVDRKTKGA